VTYKILVPNSIEDEIRSWGLSLESEDHLYALLDVGVSSEELDKLRRLAAPSPTFIKIIEFRDPSILGTLHACTLWLTYGPIDDALYIMQCDHEENEDWDTDPSDEDE
jgi:hypothetical protein